MAADWFIADQSLSPNLTRKRGGQGEAARRPHSWDGRDKPGHDQVGNRYAFLPLYVRRFRRNAISYEIYWVLGAAPGVNS